MEEPRKLQDKPMVMQLKGSWVYATAYGLFLLVTLLLQMAPCGFPAIAGIRPLPLIPLTVFVAMFEGPFAGGVFGAVAGLFWGFFSFRLLGFDALLLLVIGCACGLLIYLLLRNNWLTALLLSAVATLAVCLLDWLFFTAIWVSSADALAALTRRVLPCVLYTTAVSPLLYWLTYHIARHLKQTE